MKKEACQQFAKCLLLKQDYFVYEPVGRCGHDILAVKDEMYHRVVVVSVNDDRPIVALKTTSRKQAALREYDILIAIHLPTLATWMIPQTDVPDKETLFLSKKYDDYKVSFITLETLTKASPVLYEKVRQEQREALKELVNMQNKMKAENSYEDVEDLL